MASSHRRQAPAARPLLLSRVCVTLALLAFLGCKSEAIGVRTGHTSALGARRERLRMPGSVANGPGYTRVMAARGRSRSSGSAVGKPAAPAAKQSTNRNQLYSLIAGGLAGSISSTLTCPIEVVKMQLQSSNGGSANPMVIAKDIARLEGVKGFFRGLSPTLLGIFPSRATYFWAYESTKRVLTPRLGDGTLTHIGAGFAAGMVSNTITNPIWMVKTRMQLLANAAKGQVAYTGYRHAVKSILKEEGVRGFYKGLSASYWGCSEGCIQFVAYEKLKRHLEARHAEHCRANGLPVTDRLPPYQYFLGAAACKFLATVTTYPHEVVRTRLREQAKNGVFRYTGMWQSIMLIGKEEGRKGLYAGMGTHVARVVPNTAIMFLSYELINTWLDKRQNGQGGGRGGPQEQDPLEELIPVDE